MGINFTILFTISRSGLKIQVIFTVVSLIEEDGVAEFGLCTLSLRSLIPFLVELNVHHVVK